jgi:pyruvate dehydrogenase E1 component
MSNEEFQRLLRATVGDLRERLPGRNGGERQIAKLIGDLSDEEVLRAIRDLGGHDLEDLLEALAQADAVTDRPSVIFAYTIKAWRLATQGHPANHSALLSAAQMEALASATGADPSDPWARFSDGSAEAELCKAAASRLARAEIEPTTAPAPPAYLGRKHRGSASTQQAFGRFFVDLTHRAPEVAARVVTVSPDVASSTSLGGWINHVGIWHPGERIDWFADDTDTLVRWRESEHGQHIELGIAEGNLVGLLGELGATWSRDGQALLPIGTLYDPFVGRALEPWSFGLYAGGQSILVGTPSGVTLAPEGGAHQSIITPSIGLEQPRCIAWEPAFGQDLEWTLLYALSRLGRPDGTSSYFRLTTRPIDQALAALPDDDRGRESRRRQALAGGYRLRTAGSPPAVTLVGVGSVMPEVIAAGDALASAGIESDVLCLTSPDLLFRALQARQGLAEGDYAILDELLPADRAAPIVSALDGHPHTLSFLSAIRSVPMSCLGVTEFGQSGDVQDLYRHFGIDTDTIIGAAIDQMEERRS